MLNLAIKRSKIHKKAKTKGNFILIITVDSGYALVAVEQNLCNESVRKYEILLNQYSATTVKQNYLSKQNYKKYGLQLYQRN